MTLWITACPGTDNTPQSDTKAPLTTTMDRWWSDRFQFIQLVLGCAWRQGSRLITDRWKKTCFDGVYNLQDEGTRTGSQQKATKSSPCEPSLALGEKPTPAAAWLWADSGEDPYLLSYFGITSLSNL